MAGDDGTHPQLDAAAISRGLAEAGIGWALVCLDECDSSNREARDRSLADPSLAKRGLALFTGWQSAGRGRRGRRWHSRPEQDLLFSVAFRPMAPPQAWGRLTHAAALAVCKALEPDWQASVKWPNDIYLGERKVAGILLEAEASIGMAVIGIGINVNSDPEQIRPGGDLAAPATSLRRTAGATSPPLDRSALALGVLRHLHSELDRAADDCAFGALIREVSERSLLIGRNVSLTLPSGESLSGRARGLGAEGELLLELADGATTSLRSADQVRLVD